jgi:biotin carboxyl carrier protein
MVPYSVHPGAALEAVSNAPMDVELVDDEPEALISAKLVGVFRAAKPALAPQSQIALGQIVGYIESMKLMNEVRADMSGTVNDVLIQDGQPVEYGQPLVRVDLVA